MQNKAGNMRQNLTRGSLVVERSIDMKSCFVVQTATPILHRVPETKVRLLPSRFRRVAQLVEQFMKM